MPVSYKSDYFYNFHTGDNLVYNVNSLGVLYSHFKKEGEGSEYLIKPMLMTIGSICEAILVDFSKRIFNLSKEGVPDLPDPIVKQYKNQMKPSNDHFYHLIYAFGLVLKEKDEDGVKFEGHILSRELLGELDFVRAERNRIHICKLVDKKKELLGSGEYKFRKKEDEVYNPDLLVRFEKALESQLCEMQKYPRKENCRGHVPEFNLPWDSHLP